jgi:hypothetical protein
LISHDGLSRAANERYFGRRGAVFFFFCKRALRMNLGASWCDYHKMVLLMDQNQVFPLGSSMAPTGATPGPNSLIRRIWPPVLIGLGLGLTVAWVALMAYVLVILLPLPI